MRRLVPAGLALIAACNALAGLDELQFTAVAAGSPAGPSAGGAGAGGTASGGEGGSDGGSGGAGGPCSPYQDNCPASQKCSVVDQSIGFPGGTSCIPAGSHGAWTVCRSDGDCVRGTVCDLVARICRPLCTRERPSLACPSDEAECEAVPSHPQIGEIPGLTACTAHCHPFTGAPCNDSKGPTTCYPDGDSGDTDCTATEDRSVGAVCTGNDQCTRGSLCVDTCSQVCTPPGGGGDPVDDCEVPTNCVGLGPPPFEYEDDEYGICFNI